MSAPFPADHPNVETFSNIPSEIQSLAAATLYRVFLNGQSAELDRVSSSDLLPPLDDLWRATAHAVRAGEAPDLPTSARRAGVDLGTASKIIDTKREIVVRSAEEGIALLEAVVGRRRAARRAEGLAASITRGEGLEELEAIRADLVPSSGGGLPTPADLRGWRDEPGPEWIIRGMLQPGGLTVTSAGTGTMKSLFWIYLLANVLYPLPSKVLGHLSIESGEHRLALVEAENGARRLRRRLRELVLGGALCEEQAHAFVERSHVVSAELMSASARGVMIDSLHRLLDQTGANILLLDPLRSFLPLSVESENDNASVGRLMDQLVAVAVGRDVAVVVIDHDSKSGAVARGASAKQDAAAFVIHLQRPDEEDPAYLELEVLKARDPGGIRKFAFTYRNPLERDTYAHGLWPLLYEPADLRKSLGRSERAQAVESNLEELVSATVALYAETGEPAAKRAIAKAAGAGWGSAVQNRFTKLLRDGRLVVAEDGRLAPGRKTS